MECISHNKSHPWRWWQGPLTMSTVDSPWKLWIAMLSCFGSWNNVQSSLLTGTTNRAQQLWNISGCVSIVGQSGSARFTRTSQHAPDPKPSILHGIWPSVPTGLLSLVWTDEWPTWGYQWIPFLRVFSFVTWHVYNESKRMSTFRQRTASLQKYQGLVGKAIWELPKCWPLLFWWPVLRL